MYSEIINNIGSMELELEREIYNVWCVCRRVVPSSPALLRRLRHIAWPRSAAFRATSTKAGMGAGR
jgi:hypothetical protein